MYEILSNKATPVEGGEFYMQVASLLFQSAMLPKSFMVFQSPAMVEV